MNRFVFSLAMLFALFATAAQANPPPNTCGTDNDRCPNIGSAHSEIDHNVTAANDGALATVNDDQPGESSSQIIARRAVDLDERDQNNTIANDDEVVYDQTNFAADFKSGEFVGYATTATNQNPAGMFAMLNTSTTATGMDPFIATFTVFHGTATRQGPMRHLRKRMDSVSTTEAGTDINYANLQRSQVLTT